MSCPNPSPWRRLVRLLLRPIGASLVALLLAIARGLAGPRYQPAHTPQNQPTELEKGR